MKITNKMKMFGAALAVALAGVVALPTFAADTFAPATDCPNKNQGVYVAGTNEGGYNPNAKSVAECYLNTQDKPLMETVSTIVNVILGVVGFIAVVMIIIGGISYTTSAGDASKVKKAKDTILYGVVGLVIALLAFAIVNFVLTSVF